MIELTEQPIAEAGVIDAVRSPAAGAIVLFLGTAREVTDGRRTRGLEYQAYAEMAQTKLAALATDAQHQWPVVRTAIVHRTGHVAPTETCVAVAVSAPHRNDAFQAAAWLMDAIKRVVPIWKREHWADGRTDWIHPGPTTDRAGDPNG